MSRPTLNELQAQIANLNDQIGQLVNPTTNGTPPDRETVLHAFTEVTRLPPISRIIQQGRDPETARYTICFADGRTVRIGTIKTLWSRAELSKALAVAIQAVIAPMKPTDWNDTISGLIANGGIDVQETPDSSLEDTVRDWLDSYSARARTTTDIDDLAANRLPFIRDNQLHISAGDLAKYITRDRGHPIKLTELRQALVDLGYQTTHINYIRGSGNNKTRSSASYYRGPLTATHNTE